MSVRQNLLARQTVYHAPLVSTLIPREVRSVSRAPQAPSPIAMAANIASLVFKERLPLLAGLTYAAFVPVVLMLIRQVHQPASPVRKVLRLPGLLVITRQCV